MHLKIHQGWGVVGVEKACKGLNKGGLGLVGHSSLLRTAVIGRLLSSALQIPVVCHMGTGLKGCLSLGELHLAFSDGLPSTPLLSFLRYWYIKLCRISFKRTDLC